MKRFKLILILTFSFLFYIGCSSTAAPTKSEQETNQTGYANNSQDAANAPSQEAVAAKALYDKRCVRCHQENGEGGKNIQIGDITIDEVLNFKDPRIISESDEQYVKRILNGGDGMPKFKDKLSKDEIDLLVRYIRSEFQGK